MTANRTVHCLCWLVPENRERTWLVTLVVDWLQWTEKERDWSLFVFQWTEKERDWSLSLLIGSNKLRKNVIGHSLCWLAPVNREGTWLVTLFVDWFQWAEKERDWSLSLLIGSSEQRWNVIGHFLCWLVPTDREGTWLVSVNREKMCGPSRVPNPSGSWGRCCCCCCFSGLVRVNSLLDFSTSYSLYSTKDCSLLRCSGANWMPLKQTNKQCKQQQGSGRDGSLKCMLPFRVPYAKLD